jgi:uncharacterized protein
MVSFNLMTTHTDSGMFQFLYVPDHPFGLKDWSVLDTADFIRPRQLGKPVLSKRNCFKQIHDIDGYFRNRPTLENILKGISQETIDMKKAILVSHAPPADVGLACISEEEDVGSGALRKWIENFQPLLTLHGHLHESPFISGIHTAQIGRTIAHQPGQIERGMIVYSIITIDGTAVDINNIQKSV